MSEFLAEPRNCMLGTTNKDGSPQLTPVGFLWDGTAFYIIADKRRHWVKRNLNRDPRLSLAVDQGDDYRAVVATGKAEIRDHDIWDKTEKILVKYFGPDTGMTYTKRLKLQRHEHQVLVVLNPDRISSWGRDDAT